MVEAAEAIPLDPSRLDVMAASAAGSVSVIRELEAARALVVTLGGTATMDAGAGLLEVLGELPGPTRVPATWRRGSTTRRGCSGRRKARRRSRSPSWRRGFRGDVRLAPYADLPGPGAAGGLGAALASLGAELVPGAETVLDLLGFDPAAYDLVVTGEGTVDRTTWEGKAPAVVARRCAAAGVRCVVFGGRVVEPLEDAMTWRLSGDPARAATTSRARRAAGRGRRCVVRLAQPLRHPLEQLPGERRSPRRAAGSPRGQPVGGDIGARVTVAVRAPSSISAISPK